MKKMMLGLVSFAATMSVACVAFAQDAPQGDPMSKAMAYLGAGLAIGLAAFGGSLGQGRAAGAALEGIARNPNASGKLFVPMILGLALIESLVIYALIIAFSLAGK